MTRAIARPFMMTRLGQNVAYGFPMFLTGMLASVYLSGVAVYLRAPVVGMMVYMAWQIGRITGAAECRDELRDTIRVEVVRAVDVLLRGESITDGVEAV